MPKKQLEFERANLLPAAEFDALNRSDVLDVSPFKAQIQVTLSTTAEIDRKVLASLQKEGDALLDAAAKKTAKLLQAVLKNADDARRQEKDGAAAARKVQKLAKDCAKSIEGIAEALPQDIRKALEGELKGVLKEKAGTVSTLTFLGAKEGIRVKPGAFPDGGAADEDDEDDDKTVLTDAKAYQTYLRKMLKRAGNGMLNFAIGLGRKAEDSRFLFHKARPGKTLVNGIKAETGLKKFTWGVCAAHEEKPMLLVLALEGPQPPGLKKKAERLFKAFKPLPFNQVMLMVEGEEAEDVPDPEDLPEDYRELKAELYPALRDAVGAGHVAKDELLRLMGLADRAADTADFATAIALYIRLRGLLGAAAPQTGEGSASTGPEAVVATPPPAPGGDPGAAFTERLKTLLPRLKASAGTPAGDRAKLAASEAGVAARKKDFAQANTLLDEVEQLVGSAPASSATPPDDPAAAFAARLKDLLPRIKAAAGTPAGDAAKLLASEAGVGARKQEFAAALLLLERAEAALQGDGADAALPKSDVAPPTGLVAKRRFLVERWRRIPPELRAELEKLRTAIERDDPQEDAAEIVGLAEDYLDDFCGAMQDAIDDDIDAGDPQYRNAVASIRAFRDDIAVEPLIRHLARNANVGIETILLGALAEIEQALAA